MIRATGSSLHRVMACPASSHLPQVNEPSGPDAVRGQIIHRYLQLIGNGNGGNIKVIPQMIQEFRGEEAAKVIDECMDIDIDLSVPEFDRTDAMREMAVAYNVATSEGRIIGSDIERAYGKLDPFEIAMTIDVAIPPSSADTPVAYVSDYKTGHSKLGRPSKYAQLLLGALAMSRVTGARKVIVSFGWVRGREIIWERETIDSMDLELFAYSLKELLEESARQQAKVTSGQIPDVAPGDHCRYCPAHASCPATMALVKQLPGMDGQITRAQMGEAWEKIKLYSKLIQKMKRSIMAEAAREPIPLPSGKMLGEVVKDGRETLDGPTVHEALVMMTGDVSIANSAVKMKATKVGISAALADWAPKGGLAEANRKLLKMVRERGGSMRPKRVEVGEY
jgi:hypothetical protein